MPSFVMRLADDEYTYWSTVVDAPVTPICDRATAVQFWTEERVARADAHVWSCIEPPFYENAEAAVAFNRAGHNESCLTLDEIREQYSPVPVVGQKEGSPDA